METVKRIYVGIAGWSYADWKGIVYPDTKVDELQFISEFVDCIEINSTFYRPPSVKNSASWLRRTEGIEDFFFTAKLNRDFTHEQRFDTGLVRQFHEGFAPLLEAGRLKQLLVQFKYDYADTKANREHLKKIAEAFRDDFSIVVEVRHRSWQEEKGLEFLEALGVTVCNLDYPTTTNSFDLQKCTIGKNGYFRMHGRNFDTWFSKAGRDETYNYYYDEKELAGLQKHVTELAEAFEFLTVIANNHYKGGALANAIELKALITGENRPAPKSLIEAYPNLKKFASDL